MGRYILLEEMEAQASHPEQLGETSLLEQHIQRLLELQQLDQRKKPEAVAAFGSHTYIRLYRHFATKQLCLCMLKT